MLSITHSQKEVPKPLMGQSTFHLSIPHEPYCHMKMHWYWSCQSKAFSLHRIMIDSGSSVDLLHALANKKMGYPLTTLENPDQVIIGFNGSTTISVGDVVLSVEVGPVNLNTKFSIVPSLGT